MRSAISAMRGRRPIASMKRITPGTGPSSAAGPVTYASATPSSVVMSMSCPRVMPNSVAGLARQSDAERLDVRRRVDLRPRSAALGADAGRDHQQDAADGDRVGHLAE